MARTSKSVEDRRNQILQAAMHVFAQKGFTRATNKDIAHEAGITPGLIYHYFESKEAVLHAVIENYSPLSIIRTLPSETFSLPPATFLRTVSLQVLSIVESEEFIQVIRVFLPEIIHNASLEPVGSSLFQQFSHFLARYLESQVQRGVIRQVDTALVANVYLNSLIGFVLRRQIMRDPSVLCYSHEQLVSMLIDTALNGLLLHK